MRSKLGRIIGGILAGVGAFGSFTAAYGFDAPLKVGLITIDSVVQENKRGLYDPFYKYLELKGLTVNVGFAPSLKRSSAMMQSAKIDCVSPAYKGSLPSIGLSENDIILSEPFSQATGYITMRRAHPALENWKLLEGLRVGVANIIDMYEVNGVLIESIDAKSYERLAMMLERGRIDAAYFIVPDIYGSPEAKSTFDKYASTSRVFWDSPEAFVCLKSAEKSVEKLNAEIRRLKQSGELQSLLRR